MLYRLAMTLAMIAVPVQAAGECVLGAAITLPARKRHGAIVEPEAHAYRLADGSIVFLGRLTVDADGAPMAYHPVSSKGLDDLANAGGPGNWYGIAAWNAAKGSCRADGVPVVQGAGDPAPGFYVSTTTLQDPTAGDCRKARRYVDSSAIPYVALSPRIASIADNKGRLAAVFNPQRNVTVMAMHVDGAPTSGRGEGSIALAKALGYDGSARSGGTGKRENLFIVFPATSGFPTSAADVTSRAATAYAAWGGDTRRDACLAAVRAAPR